MPANPTFLHVQLADSGPVVRSGEVPNVITSNGDGVNDVFRFGGAGIAQAELRVFNRWGQQMGLATGCKATWAGRNSLSGEALSDGVYFFTIEGVTEAGVAFRKGTSQNFEPMAQALIVRVRQGATKGGYP